MILTNGRIYTMDPHHSVVDTLVVRDGRIVFAGRAGDVNPPAGELVRDLGGRAVLPGLVDGHAHLMHLARLRLALDLAGAISEEACGELVAAAARRAGPGAWLTGRGWDQNRWPAGTFPTRATLDRAAPGHPVALVRIDGHATWASSAALAAARIDRHAADPPGGRILRAAAGEPTGVLVDTAQERLHAVVPAPAPAAFDAAVREAIAACLAMGLTGIHEMGADLEALDAYRRLVARGAFPFRNHVALRGADEPTWAWGLDRGPETVGDARLVVGAVKLVADGALGSRGAALHAPYCDDPQNTGLLLLPPEELRARTLAAARRGFQVAIHAIGDRANTVALDACEAAGAALPPAPRRFRIEHAQILAAADVPRFARLEVIPSVQPVHCTSDMAWAPSRLGAERLLHAYAWRSLRATGVILAGGSDFPVESPNPFHGIHAAVTRRPASGEDPGWQPEQRLTREEAVRAFTRWNALAARQAADLGTLEPGRRADLVVCSDDVFTCPEAAIRAIVPVLTVVGGEAVFPPGA